MKFVRGILFIILFILFGCSTKEPIIRYEYIEVKVPVVYNINRPDRPKFTAKDSIPGYLSKLITYTETLEVIIDEVGKEKER